MSKVRLGIIGIGNMGSGHVESILDGKVPEIELAAVADQREVRRQWARETVPETVKIFETAEELLDDSDLDAVLVAVPHYDHPRYVIQALRRGFHVMCEKPAGVYTKQVREMNEEANKHDLVFGMMFNQRTNHIYRKMHELVTGGQYGAVKRVTGLSLTGTGRRPTIIRAAGALPGRERAEASF